MRALESFFVGYRSWLRGFVPGLDGGLRGPAEDREFARYAEVVGAPLPGELREWWGIHDGEGGSETAGGAIGGLVMLGVESSLREWGIWSALRAETSDATMRELRAFSESVPAAAVRLEYSAAGWLPVLKESMEANYLGVDLAPGPRGAVGQVVNFGRDEDRKVVIARSLTDLLSFIAAEVGRGEFVVSSVQPSGQPVLAHRRGRLISVLSDLAESQGPLR
jgi:cell wall assembly regulator SMI1